MSIVGASAPTPRTLKSAVFRYVRYSVSVRYRTDRSFAPLFARIKPTRALLGADLPQLGPWGRHKPEQRAVVDVGNLRLSDAVTRSAIPAGCYLGER
jgi:hypothetical protein